MREIKFRAWKYPKEFANNQKLEGEMLYVEMKSEKNYMASSHTGWMFYVYKEDMSNIMQFTGLKDKNGIEIYEGDILEYKFNKLVDFRNGEKVEPEWIKNRRVMRFIEDRFSFAEDIKKPNYFEYPSMSEVIGNIYENPELLEKCTS